MRPELTRRTVFALVAAGSISVGGFGVLSASASGQRASSGSASQAQQATAAKPRAIEVTLMPWMATHSLSQKRQLRVAFYAGITPQAIAEAQGFQASDLGSMMALVNGVQTDLTDPLSGGEHVELMVGMAGG